MKEEKMNPKDRERIARYIARATAEYLAELEKQFPSLTKLEAHSKRLQELTDDLQEATKETP